MSVRVAKSAGFCFGVSRAVELVQSSAAAGKRTVTLGPSSITAMWSRPSRRPV